MPNRNRSLFLVLWGLSAALEAASACELCAIYRAADARGEFSPGFSFTVAEQFVPYRTEQFNGVEFHRANPDFLDRSMTHFVPAYSFSEAVGVALNLPVIWQSYSFSELEDGVRFRRITDDEAGIGDASLIARWRVWNQSAMEHGFTVDLLGGVKFPTGSTDHLEELGRQVANYEAIVGPGHQHDALGNVISGVHRHDLTLGSGSVDGIFGVSGAAHWQRAFFNAQLQYYLRTEGAADYRFANELIVSGGPGVFLLTQARQTVAVQLNVVYDTHGSDELRGRESIHTGMTAWYLGPYVAFTWKSKFSALVGADLPVTIANRGFQNVPDFRFNANLTWRF